MRQATSQCLPDFGQAYLDHVMAEYELLPPSPGNTLPEHIDTILRKYGYRREELTWGDLYLLEKYVLGKQPLETVRRRLSTLRENYREIAGQNNYEAYLQLQSSQESNSLSAEEKVRADVGRLLDALHWAYSLIPTRERLRSEIIRNIGITVLLCLIPFGVSFLLLYLKGYKLSATILAVLFMGALGGFVSLQQRIQNIPTDGDPVLTILQLYNGQLSLYLAPLTGAIFAFVVFLLFIGDILSGAVFPNIKNLVLYRPVEYGSLLEPLNYGKLLVWSFVVGFAERFVPDTLTTLVGRARQIPAGTIAIAPSAGKKGTGGSGEAAKPGGKPKRGNVVEIA